MAVRRDWRRAALLLAFPVFLYLYMGAQGRYFGRWLLPAYPVLCVLAGYGVVSLATALRRPALLSAVFAALLCAQGLLASVHVDRVLGREDTRAQALDWLRANVPEGERIVVEPFVPAEVGGGVREVAGRAAVPGLREAAAGARRRPVPRGGYCTVVVGSTQKERGLAAGLRSAERYYPALGDASARDGDVLALRRGRRPRRVLLRLLVQLRAARVRAAGTRGGDPPAVGLPVTALPS